MCIFNLNRYPTQFSVTAAARNKNESRSLEILRPSPNEQEHLNLFHYLLRSTLISPTLFGLVSVSRKTLKQAEKGLNNTLVGHPKIQCCSER
jgi:hypothetical protein